MIEGRQWIACLWIDSLESRTLVRAALVAEKGLSAEFHFDLDFCRSLCGLASGSVSHELDAELFRDDRVGERTHVLDCNGDGFAGFEPALRISSESNTEGRTGGDNVAGQQGRDG